MWGQEEERRKVEARELTSTCVSDCPPGKRRRQRTFWWPPTASSSLAEDNEQSGLSVDD